MQQYACTFARLTFHGAVFPTPIGWTGVAYSEVGLARVALPTPSQHEALAAIGAAEPVDDAPPQWLTDLVAALARYLHGERVRPAAPLDLSGVTPFQRRVLLLAAEIPYGQVRTYGELARLAGAVGSARACGQALARNPVPLVIPCHRVVGANGSLAGFAGGPKLKRWLLRLEGAIP